MTERVDAVVIGMGPGGEEVAGRLAEAGLDVVGTERRLLGGECPYYGCVPTKMMVRAADLVAEARRVPGMAGDARVTPDWSPVADRLRDEATADWPWRGRRRVTCWPASSPATGSTCAPASRPRRSRATAAPSPSRSTTARPRPASACSSPLAGGSTWPPSAPAPSASTRTAVP